MKANVNVQDDYKTVLKPRALQARIGIKGRYKLVARRKDGSVKWTEEFDNIIVAAGRDRVLSDVLKGGADARITTWYIGLKNAGTPVNADTPASHGSWTENQNYTEGVRQTLSLGSVSAGSVDNSASPATFSIDTDSQVIAGAFLCSNSTKGGTTGEFYSVGDFGSTKNLDNGESLEVTVTFTAADDGI